MTVSVDEAAAGGAPGQELRSRLDVALATRPLLKAWLVSVVAAETGRVALAMPAAADHAGADPAHGGLDRAVVIALGDAAAWLSAVTGLPAGRQAATIDLRADLVIPATPVERLLARGEVIRQGRSLITVQSAVVSERIDRDEPESLGFIAATYIVM